MPMAVGVRFEDDMLARYGCGTVDAVAGKSCPAGLVVVVVDDGVLLSSIFFESLLVS